MTEQEWLSYTLPCHRILPFMESASERKLRLYAIAACRRVAPFFPDPRCNKAVDTAELLADGNLSNEAREAAIAQAIEIYLPLGATADALFQASWAALDNLDLDRLGDEERERYQAIYQRAYTEARERGGNANEAWEARSAALAAYQVLLERNIVVAAAHHAAKAVAYACIPDTWEAYTSGGDEHENDMQMKLIEDIFGNPFKPTILNPHWLTPAVTQLAGSIYELRAFDRMPLLGDALEEAGCTDEAVLKHCRSGGEHVRGCHVVDLILGKQ